MFLLGRIYFLIKTNMEVYGFRPGNTLEFLKQTEHLMARVKARILENEEEGYLADTEAEAFEKLSI